MTHVALRVPTTDAVCRTEAQLTGELAVRAGSCGPGHLHLIERSIKMRLETIAKLLVVSIVILTGSPALATQVARHDAGCLSCEQKADACRHRTFGTCVPRESGAARSNSGARDDWPAGMILG
jgi:hypothetical protein